MRVFLFITLSLLAVGCNADPRCRRETALLRAEILDLEDKYYLLKSERDALASGQPASIQSTEYYDDNGEPYSSDGEVIYENAIDGEIIYDDLDSYDGVIVEETFSNSNFGQSPNEAVRPLPPDDSILPLNSNPAKSQGDNRSAPSPNRDENEPSESSLQLPGNMSNTGSPIIRTGNDGNRVKKDMLTPPKVDLDGFELDFEGTQSAKKITAVTISDAATQGRDVDGILGDEGLELLIQPRSDDGQDQLVAGDLSVRISDPTATAEKKTIGLWKFLTSETELFLAKDERGGHGILLHLPWDQQIPTNKKLTIQIRYVTADGRPLETSAEIQITPPQPDYAPNDTRVTDWTRQDSRWLPSRDPKRSTSVSADWQRGPSGNNNPRKSRGNSSARKLTPAKPAKTNVSKPSWRPVR